MNDLAINQNPFFSFSLKKSVHPRGGVTVWGTKVKILKPSLEWFRSQPQNGSETSQPRGKRTTGSLTGQTGSLFLLFNRSFFFFCFSSPFSRTPRVYAAQRALFLLRFIFINRANSFVVFQLPFRSVVFQPPVVDSVDRLRLKIFRVSYIIWVNPRSCWSHVFFFIFAAVEFLNWLLYSWIPEFCSCYMWIFNSWPGALAPYCLEEVVKLGFSSWGIEDVYNQTISNWAF